MSLRARERRASHLIIISNDKQNMESSFLPHLPNSPGVYLMRNNAAQIIYIGKARDLKNRVASYFSGSQRLTGKTLTLIGEVRHVDYVVAKSERDALVIERRLISRYKPIYNVMWKDDKSYPYLALTMGEDFPRLFLTRKKKRDGTIYFGPYPSVSGIKALLRWAWRKKLFPLRPCDIDFSAKNLPPYKKVRSCLYLHTGECPAPCVGKISSLKYRKIAERARWFFEGNKEKILRNLEKDMKLSSKKLEFENAARLRDHLNTLRHMSEEITFREMTAENLAGKIRETRALEELTKILGFKKPPERIECFDVSHIQGVETVASMVSFHWGRPDKSQYRKFIIREIQGVDDFKAMKEAVRRRYRRLIKEGQPWPDLILLDGGKGQLSAALEAIEPIDKNGVVIAALAKKEEEIYLPKSSDPIRLPKDSPALLLLRQIRDEAHRFAITFHRLRRKKRSFGKNN